MHTGVIAAFATGTYTRTRTALGSTNSSGEYVAGAESTTSIVAVVQPLGVGFGGAGGQALHDLPDGYHSDGVLMVLTLSELRTAPVFDRVTIDGEEYGVFRVERWDAWGEQHYRAYVARRVVP